MLCIQPQGGSNIQSQQAVGQHELRAAHCRLLWCLSTAQSQCASARMPTCDLPVADAVTQRCSIDARGLTLTFGGVWALYLGYTPLFTSVTPCLLMARVNSALLRKFTDMYVF